MVQPIPYQQLTDVLDRAVRFGRQAAHRIIAGFKDRPEIVATAVPAPGRIDSSGWMKARVSNDPYSDAGTLVVLWNPETDEVRVDTPLLYGAPRPDPFLTAPPPNNSSDLKVLEPFHSVETPAKITS